MTSAVHRGRKAKKHTLIYFAVNATASLSLLSGASVRALNGSTCFMKNKNEMYHRCRNNIGCKCGSRISLMGVQSYNGCFALFLLPNFLQKSP